MLFNSEQFLIFFPIVVVLFFFFTKKIKWLWLLVVSYFFYMSWNPSYTILILLSTIITYWSGILISRVNESDESPKKKERKKKLFVSISFFSNLAILFFYKYFNFLNETIKEISDLLGFQWQNTVFNVLLPVGLSFYTFQALSYTMDVYRNDTKAEKHFGIYALFVSFFPQLVAGPIESSTNLLHQFWFSQKKQAIIV